MTVRCDIARRIRILVLAYSFEIREVGEVGGVGRNDRGSIAMTYTTGEGGGGGLYLRAGEAMAEINFSLTYDAS